MEIKKDILVSLGEDDKAVALKELQELYHAAAEAHNELKNNELTEEMKDCLLSLVESHTAEASKVLGYDSHAGRNIEERYREIRQANQKIHELEKQLVEKTPVTGLKELLYAMHSALYRWWTKQGFNLVTDDEFGVYGYKGRFCLHTDRISFMARRPVTEEKQIKSRLEQMIDAGFEFEQEDREYVLLDTQGNRDRIKAIIKAKLPSAEIVKWNNHIIHKKENFRLWDFEVYIRDLSELKVLTDEMNQIPDDDD